MQPMRPLGAHGALAGGAALLVLLRVPSLFEPPWYTDEAGYVTAARSLLHGSRLYADVWSNKPPLQTWAVALAVRLLGPTELALHLLTLATGLLTVAAVAHAARRLTSPRRATVAVLATALLLGWPVTEAQLALPDSLLVAATCWAAALLIPRLAGAGPVSSWDTGRRWPVAVGALAAAAVAVQQTALADAAAFALMLLLSRRAGRRDLLLYLATLTALTGAWVAASVAVAGAGRVAFALVGFYAQYTADALPLAPLARVLHGVLLALSAGLLVAGAVRARRSASPLWMLWLWAGAALLVPAAAHQPYAHLLTPALPAAALTLAAGLPRPALPLRPAALSLRRLGRPTALRLAPLAAGAVLAGAQAAVAGVDWDPLALLGVPTSSSTLGTYYGGALRALLHLDDRATWSGHFDDRVLPDARVSAWIRDHGWSGRRAVVWSSDAWPYVLADLPLALPTAPIYNDVVLDGSHRALVARVAALDPELVLTSDEDLVYFPEIASLLVRRYHLVAADFPDAVWLRNGLPSTARRRSAAR
jgi:4-amino-4-deoxy-L-arabinose transferase-like glycosyltransferase